MISVSQHVSKTYCNMFLGQKVFIRVYFGTTYMIHVSIGGWDLDWYDGQKKMTFLAYRGKHGFSVKKKKKIFLKKKKLDNIVVDSY